MTSRRTDVIRLLGLYPRAWRERYGAEVAALAEELIASGDTTVARTWLDLAAGAVIAWWQVLTGWGALALGALVIVTGGALLLAGHVPTAHPVGVLFMLTEAGWLVMELAQCGMGRRPAGQAGGAGVGAAGRDQRGFWFGLGACFAVTTTVSSLAPFAVPAAAIEPSAAAGAAGIALLLAGMGLRGWSFRTLGNCYRSFSVEVSPDQPVIDRGPYRLLRHPGHAGMAMACTGIGVASANWVGLAVLTALPLALVLWRIRTEETALIAVLGDRYRRYASSRKRLVPLIW
jgi:protein-S-isoprenylcysteine O-methyltransferase Ste14